MMLKQHTQCADRLFIFSNTLEEEHQSNVLTKFASFPTSSAFRCTKRFHTCIPLIPVQSKVLLHILLSSSYTSADIACVTKKEENEEYLETLEDDQPCLFFSSLMSFHQSLHVSHILSDRRMGSR